MKKRKLANTEFGVPRRARRLALADLKIGHYTKKEALLAQRPGESESAAASRLRFL